MEEKYFGAIEAGGTKFVCAIGNTELDIIEQVCFPTTTAEKTTKKVLDFFERFRSQLSSICVGSFGPIDIRKDSKTYGFITSTPKVGWQQFDFVGTLKQHFNLPIAWTTDVNAACYGEYVKGHGYGLNNVVYYTIGTGVGGGAIHNGHFIEGFSHPEMGHMIVNRHPNDAYEGNCPFHNSCLEGLAAGPTIEKRLGIKGHQLTHNHEYWSIEADYLAQSAYNTTLLLSPEKIIFGGGVMKHPTLIQMVRESFEKRLNGYVSFPDVAEYLVTPMLGDNAGTIGCLALAKEQIH